MKRALIILLAIIGLSFISTAQTTEPTETASKSISRKNEINLDLLTTIVLKGPAITYERILTPDMGLGARIKFALDQKDPSEDVTWSLQPIFRWYFSGNSPSTSKYASGFFAELNGMLGEVLMNRVSSTNTSEYYNDYSSERKITAGLGLGLGYKYVNASNWTLQTYFYLGRMFRSDIDNPLYGTFCISIGYRF